MNKDVNATARESAKSLLARIATKLVKTHHLGRNGTWLISNKTGEVQVGISKKGFTGLVKITAPIGFFIQAIQKYGVKAVQAHHMTWMQFDIPMASLEKAIVARAKSAKTSKDFSKDVYGTEMAPCWVKTAKKETVKKVKGAKKQATRAKKTKRTAKTALMKKVDRKVKGKA